MTLGLEPILESALTTRLEKCESDDEKKKGREEERVEDEKRETGKTKKERKLSVWETI